MKVYTHLKIEERYKLYEMRQKGANVGHIAIELGRAKSTISRELRRNQYSDTIAYLPNEAHKKSRDRKYIHGTKLSRYPEMQIYIITKLKEKWAPDVIAGRMRLEKNMNISTESIYQFIYSKEGKALQLAQYLPSKRVKRCQRHERKKRKPMIPDRVSIHERDSQANQRLEVGHFEADLTFFKGNQSANLMVLTERKTRYSIFVKNDSKRSKQVGKNLFNQLAFIPAKMRKSVTFDNGPEFVHHRLIREHLNMKTYFCDPHSPWQKGQVEKTNAMIHRFIPKKSSLRPVEGNYLMDIQRRFNDIPRKILGYRTPAELFKENLQGVALRA